MPNGETPCPICGIASHITRMGTQDANFVDCARCGEFVMTGMLFVVFRRLTPENRALLPYLSAYTRQTAKRGVRSELNTENWQDLARSHMGTSVSQKVMKLLDLVASRSSHPGDTAEINTDMDYPLLDAGSAGEVNYLLEHLKALRYLSWPLLHEADGTFRELPPTNEPVTRCRLTVDGWERLEPTKGGGRPGRCFVAMSFHPSLNEAYDRGIRAAVTECGFESVRIDLEHHNEKICDKILAEIRQSQFLVADFTRQRAGVYFEAGFAMALGRPVIWMCREDDFENTHFDTRQYNHIVWTVPDDLRAKLGERIMATIVR